MGSKNRSNRSTKAVSVPRNPGSTVCPCAASPAPQEQGDYGGHQALHDGRIERRVSGPLIEGLERLSQDLPEAGYKGGFPSEGTDDLAAAEGLLEVSVHHAHGHAALAFGIANALPEGMRDPEQERDDQRGHEGQPRAEGRSWRWRSSPAGPCR